MVPNRVPFCGCPFGVSSLAVRPHWPYRNRLTAAPPGADTKPGGHLHLRDRIARPSSLRKVLRTIAGAGLWGFPDCIRPVN